jgi:HJR/Mrr/RecB family endonuclease
MKNPIVADDIYVKVYDPEKKKVIATYDSYAQAARKLGLTDKVIYNAFAN